MIGLGLAKVLVVLLVAHVDLAAAHAGIATDAVVYGVVLLFCGLAMRWTDRLFGLAQVLRPELYDEIGWWLLRLGTILSFVGALAVIALEYL